MGERAQRQRVYLNEQGLGLSPQHEEEEGLGKGVDDQIQIYEVRCGISYSRHSSSRERPFLQQVAETVTGWLLSVELSQL